MSTMHHLQEGYKLGHSIIGDKIVEYFDRLNLVRAFELGFMSGRSTTKNNLE